MYNKVDTIIAKARYALSLPTLICTTGLFSQVWCLGRVYPFIHQVAKIFFTEMGGGGGKKRDSFPVSKKNKTVDHGPPPPPPPPPPPEKGHLSCQQKE